MFQCSACQMVSKVSFCVSLVLPNSPDSPQWRRRPPQARGVCQQTRAGEPDQRETLPAAEWPRLGHCLRHGRLGKIRPGCWGCQTPQPYRRWFYLKTMAIFKKKNKISELSASSDVSTLQSAFLAGSTGCPSASWRNQTYWWRSSRCASAWSKA